MAAAAAVSTPKARVRPGTSASTSSLSSPSAKPGVKRMLSMLDNKVAENSEALMRCNRQMATQGAALETMIKTMESNLRALIEDVRSELIGRIDNCQDQIDQLKERSHAQQGEIGILDQQYKDSHRRIMEASSQLHSLHLEVLGDE